MGGNHLLNWKNKVILVVEDDKINYNYLDVLLKPTKATIYHAEKGEDAVELCRLFSFFSVVLMDIRLPGMNGFEATQLIKTIREDLPVIAQTAYASDDDREAARAAGCNDFIAKPIRANEMLEMIRKYMEPTS